MIPIDEKIKEICERRKFTSFWEAFDFMKLASYSELEAIMIGLQLFKGKIWDRVVFAEKIYNNESNKGVLSATTMRIVNSHLSIDFDVDNLQVKIFIMTDEADEVYLPVYKAYAETRDYAPSLLLEKHIKQITTNLTTELGIQLFNNWLDK